MPSRMRHSVHAPAPRPSIQGAQSWSGTRLSKTDVMSGDVIPTVYVDVRYPVLYVYIGVQYIAISVCVFQSGKGNMIKYWCGMIYVQFLGRIIHVCGHLA